MKLRSRLTLVSAVVTTVSTLLIGGFAVNSARNSGIALLDKSLNQVVISAQGRTNAALSEVLYSVEQSDMALTLVYFLTGQAPLLMHESKLTNIPHPSSREVKRSLSAPVTHSGTENYRMRAIRLSDREYVVVAAPLADVDSRYRSDLLNLLYFILLCLLISISATTFLVRRDIRKIEQLISAAQQISLGKMDTEIPSIKGNSEIDQLADSLQRMVIALKRTVELEELSTRRMQEFLGDASHELRTPLTVVKGYVELLSKPAMSDPEQRQRAFARVSSEIVRMEALISDLLFLAEFGNAPTTEVGQVDLSKVLRSHLSDFSILNKDRPITADIEDSVLIHGSEPHIARLFSNILGNISRHTPANAPVVVRLKRLSTGIDVLIEDGGPGLPEIAYASGIQSFQRFDRSRSREHGGSGLGLSIIFAIVHEHGGEVRLQRSELGGLGVHIFFGNLSA